jgi:large subunit ribosomal protein L18
MGNLKSRRAMSLLRHERLRETVYGTASRPRLAVFRSARHIYAQVIDDDAGHTMASASSLQAEVAEQIKGLKRVAAAKVVGAVVAKHALAAGVSSVVFDRGGFKYHGRIQALAEGAREAGLEF